jgi:hypothetical protein
MTHRIDTSQLAQPPTFALDLFDGGRTVGWVSPHAVGFHGFDHEEEAMPAAFLAHRTLSRRLAHRDGRRPVPIGTEPLTLSGDDTVHAGARPIARIIRPGPHSRSGSERFGFELPFPHRMDEETALAKSAHIYRTLRRSGIRWAMWRPNRSSRHVARPWRWNSPINHMELAHDAT